MIDKHKEAATLRIRKRICSSLLTCPQHDQMANDILTIVLDEQEREREVGAADALDRLAAGREKAA